MPTVIEVAMLWKCFVLFEVINMNYVLLLFSLSMCLHAQDSTSIILECVE